MSAGKCVSCQILKEPILLWARVLVLKGLRSLQSSVPPPGRTKWSHVPRAPALADLLLPQGVVGGGCRSVHAQMLQSAKVTARATGIRTRPLTCFCLHVVTWSRAHGCNGREQRAGVLAGMQMCMASRVMRSEFAGKRSCRLWLAGGLPPLDGVMRMWQCHRSCILEACFSFRCTSGE